MIKEEPAREIPITKRMVYDAYKKVAANKGSAGIDKISLKEFETDLSGQLYKIWEPSKFR